MKTSVTVKNLNAMARRAQKQALSRWAEETLKTSSAIVPYKTGALSASGSLSFVSPDRAEVRYTAPYAAIQHENESFFHPNHRESGYLKKAAEGAMEEILRFNLED